MVLGNEAIENRNGLPEMEEIVSAYRNIGIHVGAMEDDDTYATLLDDSTRRLQCLTTNDIEKAIEKFNILMGKDLASRRELAQSIDYTLEEGELL